MPKLVALDEDQDTVIVPADKDADKDFFQDSERQSAVKQKYESEIKQAPWNPQANSEHPLMKLGDMIPKATQCMKVSGKTVIQTFCRGLMQPQKN